MHSPTVIRIKKRNGEIVLFNKEKIINAIFKSAVAAGGHDKDKSEELARKVISILEYKYDENEIPAVEEIQDTIERVLIKAGCAKTAKRYILYREKRRQAREAKSTMIHVSNTISAYLGKKDWKVKENSNEDYSFSGLLLYTAGTVIKNYALNDIYTQPISDAHKNGYIHIHDLSHGFIGYCCGHSLKNLLLWGFGGVPNKANAGSAKHLDVVVHQMINYIGCLQMEFAGAQAFSSVDTLLAPFVRTDNLDYKQVKQGMQKLVYSLNVPSRWGSQYPFSNLTFDWVVPEDMKNEKAIVGGKQQDFTYGDCQKEMDMINKAFLEIMTKGDHNENVFTFPIPTYNITKDFNWDSENAQLLFKLTAKYGLPYFQNYVGSNLDPKSVRAMCLHPDEEIIIKENDIIKKTNMGLLCEQYNQGFDKEGWSENKHNIKAISLNKETHKLEWVNIKRFLKIEDNRLTIIKTRDGKEIKVSYDHIIPVLTPKGIKLKYAGDITKGDYLLTTRKASRLLNKETQKLGSYIIDKQLAKFVGFFVAEGNYLYDSRKPTKDINSLKGFQFTFNISEQEYIKEIIQVVRDKFNYQLKIKKDPRYNSIMLYMYNTNLAKEFYKAGLKKYKELPQALYNSPKEIIKTFLDYFFKGDGYDKGNELHIADESLARELSLLYTLIGTPITYRKRENSQVIRIQHNKGRGSKDKVYRDTLYNRIPNFTINLENVSGERRALFKNKYSTIGAQQLQTFGGSTIETQKLLTNDVAVIEVKQVVHEILNKDIIFYDIELEENHLFVHSLGTITHNCCRLNLDQNELLNRPGGMWSMGDSTGSLGVVTMNLALIAYESKNKEEFFEKLKIYMEIGKNSLEIKRKIVDQNLENGLMPYTKRYLKHFNNHFSTIGLCGMHEACLNLIDEGIGTEKGKQLTIDTLNFMRETIREFQKQTKNLYNLEATPAESASYRLARLAKKMYPNIKLSGVNEPILTNSTQLNVDFTNDVITAVEHQNEIQPLYTGGTIFHTFLGEQISNPEAAKQLIKKIAHNTRLPYFSLTPTFSICEEHGYQKGAIEKCPECGKLCDVYSRIVGYIRPIKNWNNGKREEFKQRIEYLENKALKNNFTKKLTLEQPQQLLTTPQTK